LEYIIENNNKNGIIKDKKVKKYKSEYLRNIKASNHYIYNIKKKVEDNSILYTEPEKEFIDGHPLGNGDMGMMVTGSPFSFKFYFSKSDIWDNRTVNYGESVFPVEKYDELLKIVEEGDRDRYQKLNKHEIIEYSRTNYPSPQSCGILDIRFENSYYENYKQTLNIYNAEEKISWQTKRGVYNINSFISQDKNISEISVDYFDRDKNKIEISLYRTPTNLYRKEKYFTNGQYTGFEFIFPDGLKYVNLIYIDSNDDIGLEGHKIKTLKNNSSSLRIIQTIVTSFESEDPKNTAIQRLEEYLKQYNPQERNRRFWTEFWERSYIDLYSKDIEKIWYMGLYFIASSSRMGASSMPGLQGVWLEDYNPAWKGDYHTDLNIEMNYWPIYISNHLDLAEPFYRCYKNLIPKFRKDTKEYFKKDGIRIPIAHDSNGNELGGYLAGLFWQGSSAWIASHFWKNYLFSKDIDFLKKIAYPFMKESIKFYNSILRKRNDKYIVYLSWAPEEMEDDQIKAIDNNPTIDLSLIGSLYYTFIKMVDMLDMNPDIDMKLVKDIYKNLSDYPQKDGHITESENYDFDYCHRHLSVLTPIYPSGEFNGYNISKNKYNLALNTFYKYIKRANSTKRMYFSGTYTWLSCVAATLGLKDFANIYLSDYLDSFINKKNYFNVCFDYKKSGRGINIDDTQTFSAGTKYEFAERVFEIETSCCAAEAVNLMLLQSFKGELSIFPSYPWRDGVFEGLRAEGGFIVSSKMKDWKIESIYIKSLYGNKCTLYLDNNINIINVKNMINGKLVSVSDLKINNIENKVYFSFDTDKDCEYSIILKY
jgi:alpha-L-fucosidase 2